MANKGKTLWEVFKVTRHEDEGYASKITYALRSDGKVVKNHKTYDLAGKPKHDYGWKLAGPLAQRNPESWRQQCRASGYMGG